jgi:hypothetical protein
MSTDYTNFNINDLYRDIEAMESPTKKTPAAEPKVKKVATASIYVPKSQEMENLAYFMNTTSPREEPPIFDGEVPADYTGFATLNYADGNVYCGDFRYGVRSGIGTLTTPDRVYNANWKNDKLQGLVELKFNSGGAYIGHWEKGKRQNHGMLIYPDRTYYAGEFKKGMFHGFGIRTEVDGSFYKGMWQDNMRHGSGFQKNADGTVFTGMWVKDLPHGQRTLFHPNGPVENIQ